VRSIGGGTFARPRILIGSLTTNVCDVPNNDIHRRNGFCESAEKGVKKTEKQLLELRGKVRSKSSKRAQ